jgi:hypothetical protein
LSVTWILPTLALGVLIVGVVCYVFLLWYRAHSKPCDGVQMGPYEIRGQRGHTRTHKRFVGNLVEVTDWFFVSEVKAAFEENVIPSIKSQIGQVKDAGRKQVLEDSLKCLSEVFSKETCRLYIVRSGLFGKKELIVQYGDVSKSLEYFASHDEQSKNTISFGPVTEHFVDGRMDSLPGVVKPPDRYRQFGPFSIHMYLPFEGIAEKPTAEQEAKAVEVMTSLSALGAIIAYIPSALSIKNLLKVKDEEIKNVNRENHELQKRIGALSAELNLARFTLGSLQPDGGKPWNISSSHFRAVDLAVQMVCLVVFAAVFGFLGGPSFVGVCLALVGAVVGFGVLMALARPLAFWATGWDSSMQQGLPQELLTAVNNLLQLLMYIGVVVVIAGIIYGGIQLTHTNTNNTNTKTSLPFQSPPTLSRRSPTESSVPSTLAPKGTTDSF